jgi:dynein heavy chain 2
MLLTKPPKIEGATIGETKQHKRKLSGGEDLLKGFLHVHESAAQTNLGATPRRYIAFLNTYQQVYSNKKKGIETRQHHLQVYITPS